MIRNILFGVFSCAVLVTTSEAADVNVGMENFEIVDEKRLAWRGEEARPIKSQVFYPTLDTAVETLKICPPGREMFVAGQVVFDAKPVVKKPMPLVIMSHGTGGSAVQMLWLAEKLVKSGYLVVGVNHHGNTAVEDKKYVEGFVLWWERANDLGVVLQQLKKSTAWSSKIDWTRVGVAGFSLGGYTAVSSVGGITDSTLLEKFCASEQRDLGCELPPELEGVDLDVDKMKDSAVVQASLKREDESHQSPEIKAAFVIAPAVAQAFTEKSLKNISVPVEVVSGNDDKVAPANSNAKRISSLIPAASYSELNGVGHYTFISNCTDVGKKYLALLCKDNKDVVRQDVHDKVADRAVDFFNARLSYRSPY